MDKQWIRRCRWYKSLRQLILRRFTVERRVQKVLTKRLGKKIMLHRKVGLPHLGQEPMRVDSFLGTRIDLIEPAVTTVGLLEPRHTCSVGIGPPLALGLHGVEIS